MLGRSFGSKDRVGKLTKPQKKSFRDHVKQKMMESLDGQTPDERYGARPLISKPVMVATKYPVPPSYPKDIQNPGKENMMGVGSKTNRDGQSKFNELGLTEPPSTSPALTSAIITIVVGQEQRLFAAHEDVLAHSPFFASACRDRFFDQGNDRRVFLPDEEPETFSCVLEYLYKGDYSPRLMHDRRRNTWTLEADVRESPRIAGGRAPHPANPNSTASPAATLFHPDAGDVILRDTAVYCAADRYGLDELKRLALRKQGLQSGIEVATILRSARFAYDHTPDTDSRLRAHYLALIIRSRKTFKRSGTMQMEMEAGGKLFFDLFVAMCNHMDDLEGLNQKGTPKTI